MKTLVTGGNGFIGRHVAELLHLSGRTVFVTGLRDARESKLSSAISYCCVAGSEDYGLRLPELRDGFDEIVDLAYASVPQTSYEDPIKDITVNLPRFVRLLQFAADTGCRRFLFLSSGGTVYGQARFLPITEDHPLDPVSPYGITKLATEKYSSMYGLQRNVPTICLRPGNVYGEGQLPFRGQGFVATAIGAALTNRPITIFGNSGTVRDYIHVEDTAKAVLAALDSGKAGAVYNVGTGLGLDNIQILSLLKSILPADFIMPPVEHLPERTFDVRKNVLDSTRLTTDTSWQPEISFETGLFRSLTWLREKWLTAGGTK